LISQEKGIENPDIELLSRFDKENWKFNYKEFIEACNNAYERLKKMQLPKEGKIMFYQMEKELDTKIVESLKLF